jgi:ADP-heptose:LPS heptosyltransferase
MKILVGLIEHLGDIVACEPVARYLKTTYKNSIISWAISQPYRELADSNPDIDNTLITNCLTEWINYKATYSSKYDYIIDLHVNYRVCQECNISLYKTQGNPFVNAWEWFDHGSLLEAFSVGAGLPKLSEQPRVYISQKEVDAVDKLNINKEYIVINRSSNDISKDWIDSKWDYVIKKIIRDFNVLVVEVGTKGVNSQFKESLLDKNYINLINQTTILECAEIISRAKLFIGVDSGPAHLANAVNTKGIILLGKYLYFKSYNPFCGGYGESGMNVEIIRNINGPVREISTEDVINGITKAIADKVIKQNKLNAGKESLAQERQNIEIIGSIQYPVKNEKPDYPMVLAFYLPQFHPIPENDKAWGNGFTEWSNVKKAKPLYNGHYQPRVAGELGYYDLRDVDVIKRQAGLASEYNITGFCFYFYYFHGKRLLYRPIENFIKAGVNFPFCFLWANENWTKRWDGGDTEIIVEQKHSTEDNLRFIKELIPVFKNGNYIKINGKPLLLVYKTHLIPKIEKASELWREEVEKAGFNGIYLVHVDDFLYPKEIHPRDIGFDASYEIPTNIISDFMKQDVSIFDFIEKFEGKIISYKKFSAFHMDKPFPKYKRFKTVMLPWDNTPRYGNRAIIMEGDDKLEEYKKWLRTAYLDTYRRYEGDERMLFIHSWNEWAEGTYLEPDAKMGRKYLEATKEVITSSNNAMDLLNIVGDKKELEIDGVNTVNDYLANIEKIRFEYSNYNKLTQTQHIKSHMKEIIYNFSKYLYNIFKKIPIVGIGIKKLKPIVIKSFNKY